MTNKYNNLVKNRERFSDKEKEVKKAKKKKKEDFDYQKILFDDKNKSSSKTKDEVKGVKDVKEVENKESEKVSKEQISLDIKSNKKEYYYKVKRRLTKFEKVLDIIPFWKSFLNIFTLVFSIFIPIVMGFMILSLDIKESMPIFYNHVENFWDVYDRSLYYLIPLIIIAFNLIIIRLCITIYKFDKKLVNVVSYGLILLNLLAIINFTQTLFLVY
jgi:hypothetical protein